MDDSTKPPESALVRGDSIPEKIQEGKSPEKSSVDKPDIVRSRKPSLTREVFEALFPGGLKAMCDHFVRDALCPMAMEFLRNGWDALGDTIFSRGGSASNRSITSYDQPYRRNYSSYSAGRATSSYSSRTSYYDERPPQVPADYEELVYRTRRDAEGVLRELNEMIARYGLVTVLNFNDINGRPTKPMQDSYGWKSLATATIESTFGGYVLRLPRPIEIDNH